MILYSATEGMTHCGATVATILFGENGVDLASMWTRRRPSWSTCRVISRLETRSVPTRSKQLENVTTGSGNDAGPGR